MLTSKGRAKFKEGSNAWRLAQERFEDMFGRAKARELSGRPGLLFRRNSVSSLSGRAGDLGGALWSAARHQSIDNAPMLVFATVGTVLTLFMLKT